MAEVGLVPFARTARSAAEAVLPAQRSTFSKRVFTQPQLLAILCLTQYEDWTFREAEVRLAEHREVRRALPLRRAPDHTTRCRVLRRLDEAVLPRAVAEAVRRLPPPRGGTTVAVDATGLAPGALSTYFVKRAQEQGRERSRRYWLKWLLAVDVRRRVVLAQLARSGPDNDSATLRPLVDVATRCPSIRLVVADAEFDSERNHHHVRSVIGADSIIPARRGKAEWSRQGAQAHMRAASPAAPDGQRALAESAIAAVKRKLSSRAPGRSLLTQRRQALLLGLAYDLYRL